MKRGSIWAMLGFGAACAAAAIIGGSADSKRKNRRWYHKLEKPPFNPPDWVFAPVWTGLYTMMAWSAYRVWRTPPSPERSKALGFWTAQLAANAAWSPLFFGAKRPRAALADLGVMLGAIGLYANTARKIDPPAAWMMAPYAAWSSFALALNEEIVRRNPQLTR